MHKIDNTILRIRGGQWFIVHALDIELPYSEMDTLKLVDAFF